LRPDRVCDADSPNQIPDPVINATRRAGAIIGWLPAPGRDVRSENGTIRKHPGVRALHPNIGALRKWLHQQLSSGFRLKKQCITRPCAHKPPKWVPENNRRDANSYGPDGLDLRLCPALYIFTVSSAPSANVGNSVFFETATGNRP
jgi:hypothetical protein